MRQNHGAWAYPPRKPAAPTLSGARLALSLAATVCASLILIHVAAKAIANAAHFSAAYACGVC